MRHELLIPLDLILSLSKDGARIFRLFQWLALMFAVKSLSAVHHPDFAQALVLERRPRREAGPKTTVEQALMRGLVTA